MDSVIGRVEGKCLLTIHFVETSLMLAFLRDSNTSASVIQIINLLDKFLGNKKFSRLFPVILTDNGSEFSNPKGIEKRDTIPRSRTNVFYCDPSAPYQKGACEVNHELIRRILPKGSSFDDLTQKDIFLCKIISILIKEKSWTTVAHAKRSAFITEKICLRNLDVNRLPPKTSS